jgi:hypothetical protein
MTAMDTSVFNDGNGLGSVVGDSHGGSQTVYGDMDDL